MSGLLRLAANDAPAAAVLLVLLPGLAPLNGHAHQTAPPAFSPGVLAALQRRLGAAVRVMQLHESAYPAVVRSFAPTQLPTCVLVHQGVELWRQPGLPDPDIVPPLLLAKLGEAAS